MCIQFQDALLRHCYTGSSYRFTGPQHSPQDCARNHSHSTKHIANLLKRAFEHGWNPQSVLLDNHVRDKLRPGRKLKITADVEEKILRAVTLDRYGREKSAKIIALEVGSCSAQSMRKVLCKH